MEIMPEQIKKRAEKFQKETIDLSKEIILDLIKDEEFMNSKKSEDNEKDENFKKNIKKVLHKYD